MANTHPGVAPGGLGRVEEQLQAAEESLSHQDMTILWSNALKEVIEANNLGSHDDADIRDMLDDLVGRGYRAMAAVRRDKIEKFKKDGFVPKEENSIAFSIGRTPSLSAEVDLSEYVYIRLDDADAEMLSGVVGGAKKIFSGGVKPTAIKIKPEDFSVVDPEKLTTKDYDGVEYFDEETLTASEYQDEISEQVQQTLAPEALDHYFKEGENALYEEGKNPLYAQGFKYAFKNEALSDKEDVQNRIEGLHVRGYRPMIAVPKDKVSIIQENGISEATLSNMTVTLGREPIKTNEGDVLIRLEGVDVKDLRGITGGPDSAFAGRVQIFGDIKSNDVKVIEEDKLGELNRISYSE
ncbi:hypothetical protein ACFL3T_01115 [Patescibacteria group bacterium]